MSEVNQKRLPPVFVILACALCAFTIGLLCWDLTLKSDAKPKPTDNIYFLLYECLAFGSYLAALWFCKRLTTFLDVKIIPALFLISICGTTVPYVVSSLQIWHENKNYLDVAWFIPRVAWRWVVLNVAMLIMMAIIGGAGFLLTWLNVKIAAERRAREIAGI